MPDRNRPETARRLVGQRNLSALAVVIGLAALPGFASAAVLRVPAEFASIGAALESAASGDTIRVAPGVYFENVVWPATQGLKLFSDDGADLTIIDGSATEAVITIQQPIDANSIIRGFTLRNGQVGGT